jgi:hypothetical protein
MRGSIALWFIAGCGRVAFDPVGGNGGDGSVASSCPTFALFCDGFESGDISAWSGRSVATGGTVVASQEHVHAGSFALDATMPMLANGSVAAVLHDFPPASSGVIAVRVWIYTLQPLIDYNAPLNFVDVFGHYALVAGAGPNWVISEKSTGGGLVNHFGTPIPPVDTWTCVELDVTFSPPQFALFVDDTLSVAAAPADPAPLYRQIEVGIARADIAGYRVFVDDVVQADQHIGCQ